MCLCYSNGKYVSLLCIQNVIQRVCNLHVWIPFTFHRQTSSTKKTRKILHFHTFLLNHTFGYVLLENYLFATALEFPNMIPVKEYVNLEFNYKFVEQNWTKVGKMFTKRYFIRFKLEAIFVGKFLNFMSTALERSVNIPLNSIKFSITQRIEKFKINRNVNTVNLFSFSLVFVIKLQQWIKIGNVGEVHGWMEKTQYNLK